MHLISAVGRCDALIQGDELAERYRWKWHGLRGLYERGFAREGDDGTGHGLER